jgi:alpha-tubulin suppressor-like RCC1 family protein
VDSLSPRTVKKLNSGAVAITAGSYHSCAVTGEGGAKCWGWNNLGQIGDGTPGSTGNSKYLPVFVQRLKSAVSTVAGGNGHSCAIANGRVKCWGNNAWGQLGDGSGTSQWGPVTVVARRKDLPIGAVVTGYAHSCKITSAEAVRCWGAGGTIGDGTNTQRPTPSRSMDYETA